MPTIVSDNPYMKKNGVKTNIAWDASIIKFTDGEDLQAKLSSGKLSGSKIASEITTTESNVQQELNEIRESLGHAVFEYQTATVPTISNLTYNGSEQTVQINDFDSNAMTKSGDLTVTEPGEYSITFTLQPYWKWPDDSDAPKTITFNVNKKTPTFSRVPSSLILNNDNTTGTITYTTDSNGELSVTSTDNSVASVSLSDNVATVTGLASGTATIQGSVAASSRYSATSIISTPISVSFGPSRIGLLWDGSGFYRVDRNLNVISDSNFNPETTFPYSEISIETVDGASGVTWPVIYTSAENATSKNATYGRVWWIDSEPSSDNHVCPSFVASGVTKSKLWLKATLELEITYNDLCTKTKNTVMNFYDYFLMTKLILIEYNTGTNPPQNSLAAKATWRNLQQAWGSSSGTWIFGADMISSGTHSATTGNGNLRILNPSMNGSFIDTGLTPSNRWIKGNFNIGTVNGINMGDFMFDTSRESSSGQSLTSAPFATQAFNSNIAFRSVSGAGLLGFSAPRPDTSNAWRLRKVI